MAGEAGFDHINHLWSLSVEEQFYIVWPVVLMVAGRRALPVALLGIVASAAWRAHLYDGVWLDVYSRTDARADAFLEIGRAPWRERVWPYGERYVVGEVLKQNNKTRD